MKIERDKVYLTRCGDKVRVVCVDAGPEMPIVAVHPKHEIYTHRTDGGFLSEGESGLDLVSEYVEPPKPREVWVHFGVRGDVACGWSAQELEAKDPAARDGLPPLVKFREVIEA